MEADVFESTAGNNTQTIWQGSVGSIGGVERGEFDIDIFKVPGRSYHSPERVMQG